MGKPAIFQWIGVIIVVLSVLIFSYFKTDSPSIWDIYFHMGLLLGGTVTLIAGLIEIKKKDKVSKTAILQWIGVVIVLLSVLISLVISTRTDLFTTLKLYIFIGVITGAAITVIATIIEKVKK